MLFFGFSLKNEHNGQIKDVFKKTDKLPVLLSYTSVLEDNKKGVSTSNFIRKLHHGCVGQFGNIIILAVLSETISWRAFPIT